MSEDAWPTHIALRSPFNHNTKAAACEPHLKPSVSPETIQQIANEMDRIPDPPPPQESQCQQILHNMPDIPESDHNFQKPEGELQKLLKAGHKPLDKVNGQWKETSEGAGKLILE